MHRPSGALRRAVFSVGSPATPQPPRTPASPQLLPAQSEDVLVHTTGASDTASLDSVLPATASMSSSEMVPAEEEAIRVLHGSNDSGWESTLCTAARAVVALRVNLVRSFDTERATFSQATGFIVDLTRGLVLSNRHVVTPGPIIAEAVLHNHEEVSVWPVYRDPVHDFGFFQFDVTKVRYSKLTEIPLAPALARVGMEVRVMGNDSAEKLSILAGTLARMDRPAPFYGVGKYNDFNSFYYQAASGTSGGSSGSPVLDVHGNAIAMNAGGKRKAASSFYIPLDRVLRALHLIQANQPITRGTLQCVFKHEPFDELRRLGLSQETEDFTRKNSSDAVGMLVVEQVTPKGPTDQTLEPGDILTHLNGQPVINFVQLEDVLDESTSWSSLTLERGGQRLECTVPVDDLHRITPARYATLSGAVLHELSYQLAFTYAVPVSGVYVASAGYMLNMAGIQRNCVITMVNNRPTPTLDSFIDIINDLEDNVRVPIRFLSLSDIYRERVTVAQLDRHWHPFALYQRNDSTGLWDEHTFKPAKSYHSPPPATVELQVPEIFNPAGVKLIPSLVLVEAHVPFLIDGVHGSSFMGTGLIVDTEKGLVLVDSNTVPISPADVKITIASSLVIPARVEFHHPTQNFSIISYDPKLVGDTPLVSAQLSRKPLQPGEAIVLVGLSKSHQPVARATFVTTVREMLLRECNPPRYRATNVDAIEIDNPLSCQGGVLIDPDTSQVRALWASYSYQENEGEDTVCWCGLDINVVHRLLDPMIQGERPQLRSMEVECGPLPLVMARNLGVTEEWIRKFERAQPRRRNVLTVRRLVAGTEASKVLREGDVILSANGSLVTGFSDLDCEMDSLAVELLIVRDGEISTVNVPTAPLESRSSDRIVGWAGVILQKPHRATLQQRRDQPSQVYSSYWYNGSPAHMYNLRATMWITEVNGQRVRDLEQFLQVIQQCDDSSYTRLKTTDFSNRQKMLTIKPNRHYWPAWELRVDPHHPAGWRLLSLSPS